ncbi:putative ricin B-like lectin [Helianthus annuus]|nr:putative ricin B-like lectin [Helianthus annuus]
MDHQHHHNTPAHHEPSPPTPQPAVAVHHVSHQTPKYTDNKPTVRFYCKAKPDYSLTIRNGQVVLAPTNPSDHHQHWIKEEKYSTIVDEEGYPSFALVNKATGQAIKHSMAGSGGRWTPFQRVQLGEYNPDKLDESVLWTQSKDLGDGFHAVRVVNDIKRNVDAWNGDKDRGGVIDGTKIYLCKWTKGDNQRWTTAPFCSGYDVWTAGFGLIIKMGCWLGLIAVVYSWAAGLGSCVVT